MFDRTMIVSRLRRTDNESVLFLLDNRMARKVVRWSALPFHPRLLDIPIM